MFASKLPFAAQRHPLNNIRKPIETWDDDSELDVEGDLFSKLSTLENQGSSSSLASSRNSKASFSFEDELMALDFNDGIRKPVNKGTPFTRSSQSSSLEDGAGNIWESNATNVDFDDWGDDIDFGDSSAMLTIKAAKRAVTADIIGGNLFTAPTQGSGTLKQRSAKSPRLQLLQKSPTMPTLSEMDVQQPDPFESMEMDFEIPESLKTLELKTRLRPQTPLQLDSDIEGWGDESVNSRYAGSRRDTGFSNRSSMVSTFSPASSSVTYESEDEGLLGLQIPQGPLNFQQLLDMRMKSFSPEPPSRDLLDASKEDFFDGLEIGDEDDIFDAGKLTVNRNVKHRSDICQSSPQPKATLSNATLKPTRIPRPVSQTSATMSSQARAQQSVPKPSSSPPLITSAAMKTGGSRPERRLSHKASMISVKTTSNQLNQRPGGVLLSKKSMPALRTGTTESSFSNQSMTPTVPTIPDWHAYANARQPNLRRMTSRSGLALPLPTQPAEATPKQKDVQQRSQPALPKYTKKVSPSLNGNELPSGARHTPSPKKDRHGQAPGSVRWEAATTKTLLKPVKRRLFGDGTELDEFEDLPISTVKERTFLMDSGKGKGLGIMNGEDKAKAVCEKQTPSAMNRRATILREKPPQGKGRRKTQQRPHLIKPLGNIANAPRSEKGMRYNPATYTWEGNDNVTADFDDVALTPPRPALISNITSNKGVQIVGGMIFDPVRMCWFKAHDRISRHGGDEDEEDEDDVFAGFDDLVDDMSHLHIATPKLRSGGPIPGHIPAKQRHSATTTTTTTTSSVAAETGNVYGEFVVGEEFDVGPGFIRRQTDEEERWRRKVQGWIVGSDDGLRREYLYEIRSLIMNGK
ncbi:hypothetical protein V1525DRAFT_372969 [Lipomyces kononenkoae]|uniref:Uncharacterized protein n=1 Tax=Lipomyces kononenkoae TaxID=34357 RepID=A0ACC3T5V9_LIPKO